VYVHLLLCTLQQTPKKAAVKPSNRHKYRPIKAEYASLTTQELFDNGHVTHGNAPFDSVAMAEQLSSFHEAGKWDVVDKRFSTHHNDAIISDHFPAAKPFLDGLAELCVPTKSSNRPFKRQRVHCTPAGVGHEDHRDGDSPATHRVIVSALNPAAPAGTKLFTIGMSDPARARSNGRKSPWLKKVWLPIATHWCSSLFMLKTVLVLSRINNAHLHMSR
jgi:hypothetical protein